MKNLKSYIGLMLLSLGMASCSNEFDRPPLILPEADIEANTTLLELKELYWQDGANYATQIGTKSNGDHIIVEGVVTSSDESGNIFKNLMITDGTAALTISINEYDLYTMYGMGQKLVIDMTDMYIGKYSGLVQLGIPEETDKYGTQISRMTIEEFKAHAQADGMPNAARVTPIDFDLSSLSSDPAFMRQWQSQLIKLSGVTFADGGKATFAESQQSVSRTLTDENGNSIIVYNSGYADFYDQILPKGKGDVVGILSYFSNKWQLLLRDETDCMNFVEQPDTPDVPDTPVNPVDGINENFESGTIPSGWTNTIVAGNKDWFIKEFDNNHYASCSAYNGKDSNGYDSWLITPPVNADNLAEKVMHFRTQVAYSGNCDLEVFVMTTNNPETATKTKLNANIPTPPASGYSDWMASGNLDLSTYSGIIYIGFRYTAETASASRTYCIDDIVVGAASTDVPDTPDTPDVPDTPDTPDVPTGDNIADFNTMNDGTPKSTYGTYTSANGWVATNCALLSGDDNGGNTNPKFAFIGSSDTFAPTLNGKTTASGSLVSPTLTGGISTLKFSYGFAFSDTKCDITINIKQNGTVVASNSIVSTDMQKQVAYNYEWSPAVSGDFVIEIINNCPSASSSNKDRVSIWNLTWTN